MAVLTNPVTTQNIVDRFADYVQAAANTGIVWYNNGGGAFVEPFAEFNQDLLASNSGKGMEITGASINATPITASTIYNALVAETNRFTRIRNLRARRIITTGGGNRTRNASDALDLTNIAHMAGTTYQGDIGTPSNGGVSSGSVISSANLETLFTTLRTSYNTIRATAVQIDVSLCHNSCHSSCHGSRGRR